MAAGSCIPPASGHTYNRTKHMKLFSTLLATTAIANAAVVFDTRIDITFDGAPGQGPTVVYDNVGAPISFTFFEFDPKTIYMNVYNEVDRDQVVDQIAFNVNDRIPIKSANWFSGAAAGGGDGGVVEGTVSVSPLQNIYIGLNSPGTTDSTGAEHSGGTSFTILWEFEEPTTSAAFADAFSYTGFANYGIDDMTVRAGVIDFGSRVDDVNDLTDWSLPYQEPGALFYLAGTVVPEPSSAMLAFLGLLPILRRNRK